MRYTLAAALALVSLPALAADGLTLTATINGVASTKTVAMTATDLNRVLVAYGAACPQVDTGTKDGQGQPILRACTNAETFTYLANGIFAGIKNNVLSYEQGGAAKTAKDAVAAVTMQ